MEEEEECMHAAKVREIECKSDCMQMQAMSSIRAPTFPLREGEYVLLYHLTVFPRLALFYPPDYSNHAVQMRKGNSSCDEGNRLRVMQLIGASRAEKYVPLTSSVFLSRGIDCKYWHSE